MSLHEDLEAIARVAGVADLAQVDFITRGLQALPAHATAQDIAKWVQALRPDAPHLFVQPVVNDTARQEREAIVAKMSPSEKLTRGRQGQEPVQRGREQRLWSAEELKATEGKTVHERLTMGHGGPPKAS